MATQGSMEHAKVNDVVITETKDGIKEWEIYAAVGEYDTKKTNAILTDVVGNYYQNQKVIMSFTSPSGTYNSDTKEVSLTGGVRIVGKDNMELTADKIYWITTDNKVHAEGNVIFNQNNELIALSDKASTTTDLTLFEIMENAEVRVYKKYNNKRGQ